MWLHTEHTNRADQWNMWLHIANRADQQDSRHAFGAKRGHGANRAAICNIVNLSGGKPPTAW